MDPPGGPHFRDVTELFNEAAYDMDIGDMLMADGYTLNEAMSAIEIGDPRMDSGAPLPEEMRQPEFDPLAPMLPEEVCWILDRTFACEMQWHAGTTLSQTVHTCLYMHNLTTISPEYLARSPAIGKPDYRRPLKLTSVVIRAGVLGMVKSCDMAYRELVKGNVHDCEDWQGEKADVSLYEGTATQSVIDTLDFAESWLRSEEAAGLSCKDALLHRIGLRKLVLRLFALDLSTRSTLITPFVAEARRHLQCIMNQPISDPASGSPAYGAFDPYITRRLHSVMPLKPVTLPPQANVWKSLAGLFDGWEELSRSASCQKLLSWEISSNLRTCLPTWSLRRTPYLRSAMQSVFSNGTNIFDNLPHTWLVDRFFLEIVHVPLSILSSIIERRYGGFGSHPFEEFQNNLAKLLVQHIWASYHNRARHRRHLMNTAFEWHAMFDMTTNLVGKVKPKGTTEAQMCQCIPLAILHWRVGAIRDIILSGFELDLYSNDERSFCYWYLSQILGIHERLLQQLLGVVPRGTPAQSYLRSQIEFAAAIGNMSAASFLIYCCKSKNNISRRWTNFMVRYKWAMRKEYDSLQAQDAFRPDMRAFLQKEKLVLAGTRADACKSAQPFLSRAKEHLLCLQECIGEDSSFQLCRADYTQHLLGGLVNTCTSLQKASEHTPAIDKSSLKWVREICPWFPQFDPPSCPPE